MTDGAAPSAERAILEQIVRRALALSTKMIFDANHRSDAAPGDPKVGGHPAAASSSLHVLSALHLVVRAPEDWIASKPHASPADHALSFLLGLLRHPRDGRWLDGDEAAAAMGRLRQFPRADEPVFQSYHAESDPDAHHLLPSGSVGIPPVVALFSALAHRYARDHGLPAPAGAHFWALLGDAEFREGSLLEALPEAAERRLGNLTWIVDYNRQSLEGPRVPNLAGMSDADRIEATARANGWAVVQLRHGPRRRALFDRPGGALLAETLERTLSDFELQLLIQRGDARLTRERLLHHDAGLAEQLDGVDDDELVAAVADLGGHDLDGLIAALTASRSDPHTPTLIIAHTVKGWGLQMAAAPGNHSALPDGAEVEQLLADAGLDPALPYRGFEPDSDPGRLLRARGEALRRGFERCWQARDRAAAELRARVAPEGLPASLDVDLSLMPRTHTQWMWGQLAARLVRIGATDAPEAGQQPDAAPKPLAAAEAPWRAAGGLMMTLSPDVGTSTNLSPVLDGKVYAPAPAQDYEQLFAARDRRRPALSPSESPRSRHLRFDIAEANAMSAVGALGKMGQMTGATLLPVMVVYDFFIKRALDQLYYNLYWGSSFMLVGTPSGVTLSPEGAQHSWKSDLQMPELIAWEPLFARELDWIVCDAVRRHFSGDNGGRRAVLLRLVTRGIEQRILLERLGRQRRFKRELTAEAELLPAAYAEGAAGVTESEVATVPPDQMLGALRTDVLAGGYHLVDYRGYAGYQPGENVVNIFALGPMGVEALAASDRLLDDGIYANVIVVTCADLLVGTLAERDDHRQLRQRLGIDGDLHLVAGRAGNGEHGGPVLDHAGDLLLAAGRRVPCVSVCDGEPGLLDNIGSAVGVRQIALGLRKASKSGRPADVYAYHGIDAASIRDACLRVLAETALEQVRVSRDLLRAAERRAQGSPAAHWRDLLPGEG